MSSQRVLAAWLGLAAAVLTAGVAAAQADPPPPMREAITTAIPGVVEHGLFIGLAQAAILAGPAGVRVIERP